MKPRVCFSERTPSLKPVDQFGAPPADSPALRRLISLGLGALALWVFVGGLVHVWPTLFPSATIALEKERRSSATQPAVAPRAILVREDPLVPRALPVIHSGDRFQVRLPDGRELWATERGRVPTFGSLPPNPQIGDHYTVTEGGADQGVSWLWYTPLGWSHPGWIDP